MPTLDPSTAGQNESPDSGRRWARYPIDATPVVVNAGKLEFEAVTVDESIGGLGIKTENSVPVMDGQVVELVYHGVRVSGQVSAVAQDADGGCRISIRWEEKELSPEESARLAFLEFGPVKVVCDAQFECHDPQQIRLWDGKQFEVSAGQLTFCTKRARLVELQAMQRDERIMTARLYGLNTQDSPQQVIQQIFEFESAFIDR